MTFRTTETTIRFRRQFTLTSVDSPQPAGIYRLVTDEEEIAGPAAPIFQRTATVLYTPALSPFDRPDQGFLVNASELAAAHEADSRNPPNSSCP
jgi:hypothetical protein